MRLLKSMEFFQLNYDSPEVRSREFEEFLESFFRNFRNSNGTWKTTARSRHDGMDEALIRVLARRRMRPRVVMDVGVASGVTTVALKKALERQGFEFETIATDRTINGYVARLHQGLDVLIEPRGHILKIELHGRDFSPWCSATDYLDGLFLFKAFVRRYVDWRFRRAGLKFPLEGEWEARRQGGLSIEGPYFMVTPELKGRPNVTILEDDILSPRPPGLTGVADVVRLAHVLRPDRLSAGQIRRIVRNVRVSCRDGAVVLVCRSNPRARARAALEGSFLIAVPGGGFELEERIGPGSEVENYFVP
jgi:hypothetical protein